MPDRTDASPLWARCPASPRQHRGAAWAALCLGGILLAGCHLIWGLEASVEPGDAAPAAPDMVTGVADAPANIGDRGTPPVGDGAAAEADMGDQGTPPVGDGAPPDQPPQDLPRLDSATPPPDLSAAVDSGSDGATAPCGPGAVASQQHGAMVLCSHSSTFPQATAHQLCGNGWHLCTGNEFKSQGGQASDLFGGLTAWIASCVRDGSGPHLPTDGACTAATTTSLAKMTVAERCSGGSAVQSSLPSLGVVTHGECYALGPINLIPHRAYWNVRDATAPLSRAVCCPP